MKPSRKGGKAVAKGDLPSKTCLTCGRPFTWRKKWAKDWEAVKYCSVSCRSRKITPSQCELSVITFLKSA
ncbi:DUF2256 domain-containing protein [Caulobacter sp. CCH9-E1]|uniref:DUF2256 domain-containing protein n=1 Tax=Caulobacter sp. CCH9-E1 TaxID=1768768 RepID=UPI0009EBD113|nr:DUF2256 domain-containing protein [Caulobacter sp. CCH9-E1]